MSDALGSAESGAAAGTAISPGWGTAIGALLGLLKSSTIDSENEHKDQKMASITARYSPWTGMTPDHVNRANPVGEALTYGAQGGALAQGFQKQASDSKIGEALAANLSKQIRTPAEKAGGAVGGAGADPVASAMGVTGDIGSLSDREQAALKAATQAWLERKANGY